MRLLPAGTLRPHVVVLDDEPEIRDLLSAVLEREGYRVSAFSDGEEALACIGAEEVRVLLTDLKMPNVSGLEIIRRAKSLRPDVGSVLVTGYASTETAVEALRLGADDFVSKPFGVDDLRRVVDRVLQTRRMLSQERDALDHARSEAETLRERGRVTQAALETVQHDLRLSRRDLERRVRDLEFVAELTAILSKTEDLQRLLETTVTVLTERFDAAVTRVVVETPEAAHVAEHVDEAVPRRVLATLDAPLFHRARTSDRGMLRDMVLGFGRPLEALVAPLDLRGTPAGGIAVLRPVRPQQDPGEMRLFGLVPQALATAVEAELARSAAVQGALGVATGILRALEGRGTLFQGHADRTARLAREIARRLGLSVRLQDVIETAARLHDVGKVGIPDGVLQHGGPLSDSDRELIRAHPVLGARILAPFGEAAALVRHHHERPDGRGYPDGLRGGDIPLGAAIIGAAEAYDAMTHRRPWRASLSRAEARGELERNRGTAYPPDVVDALLSVTG